MYFLKVHRLYVCNMGNMIVVCIGVQYGISGELFDCFGIFPLHSSHRAVGPLRSPGAVSLPKEGII